MRTHGHRAARIDPLDLIQREEVAALDPKRYGLNDETKKYNVNGIIWTKPVSSGNLSDEWWTLGEITRHLRSVYVGRIAHEVWLALIIIPAQNLTFRVLTVHALAVQNRKTLVLTSPRIRNFTLTRRKTLISDRQANEATHTRTYGTE